MLFEVQIIPGQTLPCTKSNPQPDYLWLSQDAVSLHVSRLLLCSNAYQIRHFQGPAAPGRALLTVCYPL